MNLIELEEALSEILPPGFIIETDNHGQVIIYTGLTQDDDGDLTSFEGDEDDDLDPDFNSVEEDDDD